MYKIILTWLIIFSSCIAFAFETRVLEFKYSLYGGYNFTDSILYSGTGGTGLGKKWVNESFPDLTDSLENIQINRLDKTKGAPFIGADVWYFMRPNFAWTLGLTYDVKRDITNFTFDSNLPQIVNLNNLADANQAKNLVDDFGNFLSGFSEGYESSESESLSKYSFSLIGVHLGASVIFMKKMVFNGALSYYYPIRSYNDLNSVDLAIFPSGVDFDLSSRLGFRLGGGWFVTKSIMIGLDYRYVSFSYALNKKVTKGFLGSVIGSFTSKNLDDYFKSYNENLLGSMSGVEGYLKYFF